MADLNLITQFTKKYIKYLNFKEKQHFQDFNPWFQSIRDKISKVCSCIYYIPYKSEYFKIAQSVLCNTYVGD